MPAREIAITRQQLFCLRKRRKSDAPLRLIADVCMRSIGWTLVRTSSSKLSRLAARVHNVHNVTGCT